MVSSLFSFFLIPYSPIPFFFSRHKITASLLRGYVEIVKKLLSPYFVATGNMYASGLYASLLVLSGTRTLAGSL